MKQQRPMRLRSLLMLSAASFGLAGCYGDPFQNPGDWSMTGAPRENLAQQTAQKSDLLYGRSEPLSNGVAASAAVEKSEGGPAGNAAGLQAAPPSLSTTGFSGTSSSGSGNDSGSASSGN